MDQPASLPASVDAPTPLTLDAVYRAHASYVARIGYRLLGRPEDVEDLVQDVFIEVHKGLHKLEEPAALRGWLARITTRMAFRRLRKRKLLQFISLDHYDHTAQLVAPDASADQRVLLAQLFQQLDRLPTDCRVIWSLRHLEGLSLEEVADACDTSLTTVKRRLAAAQELLREVTHGS